MYLLVKYVEWLNIIPPSFAYQHKFLLFLFMRKKNCYFENVVYSDVVAVVVVVAFVIVFNRENRVYLLSRIVGIKSLGVFLSIFTEF